MSLIPVAETEALLPAEREDRHKRQSMEQKGPTGTECKDRNEMQRQERKAKCVKSTSPDTENHDKNGYVKLYNNKNFMTNVDINSDTKYTNTNDMNKHDARDLHK